MEISERDLLVHSSKWKGLPCVMVWCINSPVQYTGHYKHPIPVRVAYLPQFEDEFLTEFEFQTIVCK